MPSSSTTSTATPNELHNVARAPAYADVRAQLTRLWWRYRDCAGAACTRPLPARFRADADQAEAATRKRAGVEAFVGEQLAMRSPVAPTWPATHP